jgi:hypothetical protein
LRDETRRKILKVHGTLMIILGGLNAIVATVGMEIAKGPMAVLHDHAFGHVGLVQAYLLIMVIGVALWLGAKHDPVPRRWNAIGAGTHLAVLPAYLLHWSSFVEYVPNGDRIRYMILVHLALGGLETFAALRGRHAAAAPATRRMATS